MSALPIQLIAFIRGRAIVSACLAIAILLGGANYFLWQKRVAVEQRHEDGRRKGEFMLQALSNRARIESDLAALSDGLSQIEGNLMDEPSMEVNLGYFYRFERMNRVRLVRLNQLAALPPTAGNDFKALPFSMQISGSYRNNMSFLRALETGPRVLRVRSCSFERANNDGAELILNLVVEVLAKT
jgi:Tfp pilus assembly protein PilO